MSDITSFWAIKFIKNLQTFFSILYACVKCLPTISESLFHSSSSSYASPNCDKNWYGFITASNLEVYAAKVHCILVYIVVFLTQSTK